MPNFYMLNEIYTNGFHFSWLDIISIISVLCGISVIVAKNPIVSVLFLIGLFFGIAAYLMMLGMSFIGLSYLLVYVGAVSILFLFILMLINVRISELITDNNNSFLLAFILGICLLIPVYTKGNLSNSTVEPIINVSSETIESMRNLSNKTTEANTDLLHRTIEMAIEMKKDSDSSLLSYEKQNNLAEDAMQSFNDIYNTNSNNIFFVTSKVWDGVLGQLSHITNIGGVLYTNYPMWLILTSIILLLAMVGAIIITIKK